MARTRVHDDGCGIAHATDLLGQRWALLVVRELLLGAKRFTDLRTGIPDISPNVLGQRLRELESSGILRRRKLPPPVATQVYELTDWGRELEPAVLALGRWASHSRSFPVGAVMGPDSLVLALKTTFQPQKADGLDARFELWLGEIPYEIRVRDGAFEAERGEDASAGATIRSDPDELAGVVFGGKPFGKAVKSGAIQLEGDRRSVRALFRGLGAAR
jgi:DNA-binding HxlR family transcriptional regulator